MRNTKRLPTEPDQQQWENWLAGPPPPKKGMHPLLIVAIAVVALGLAEVVAFFGTIGSMWLACHGSHGSC